MKMRRILMHALAVGAGLATGRLFIDLMVEPKPAQTAAAFSLLAFGVGFLISMALFAVGWLFRSKGKEGTQHLVGGWRR
jgi:hypothetical protein